MQHPKRTMMSVLRESHANEKRRQAEAEKKEDSPKSTIKARPTSSRHNLPEKRKTMTSAPFLVPSTPLNRPSSVTRSSFVSSPVSARSVPVTAPRFAAIPSSIPTSESALEKLDDDDRKHLHKPYPVRTRGHAYGSSANNTLYQHHQRHGYGSSTNNTSYQHQAASDVMELNDNLYFYMNKMKSKPSPGYLIEEMLKWKGDYHTLDVNDCYIQWLFPNFDTRGLNSSAQPLQEHEAMVIAQTPGLRDRFVRAYKMMLHFYGMELKSTKTGEIQRCEENWKDRFRHLNISKHNHIRITRILHSLVAFGFHKYQEPLIMFVMENENVLPCLQGETLTYWWNTIPSEDRGLHDLNSLYSESEEGAESGFDKGNCKNNTSYRAEYENLPGLSNKVKSCHSEGAYPIYIQDEKASSKGIGENNDLNPDRGHTINLTATNASDVKIEIDEECKELDGDGSNTSTDLSHKEKSASSLENIKDTLEAMETEDSSSSEPDHKDCPLDQLIQKQQNQQQLIQHQQQKQQHNHIQQPNNQQWKNHRQPQSEFFQKDPSTKDTGCTSQRTQEKLDNEDDRKLLRKPYTAPTRHGYGSSTKNTPYQHQAASDVKELNDNLYFYMNKMKSKPSPGFLIEEMLKWKGDYHTLEINHSYIQWLFPNFDSSAKPLRRHEAMAIAQIPELRDRFVRAYKMMLHFYGMELKSTKTGEIQRCEENWRDRFRHLNSSKHNHFRITRILHSLAAFGFHKYQEPLIMFVMENENVLPRLQGETLTYWWNASPSEESWLYGLNYRFSESGDVNESSFDEENCENNTSDNAKQGNLQGILNKVDSLSSAPDHNDCPLNQQQLIQQQQQNQQHNHIQQPNNQQRQNYRQPQPEYFQKDPQTRETGLTAALTDYRF